ncbi:MAG: DUF58 domain-containing protein [Candidatus Marinimicrobia bacterium]|nr:DUF58 domain-containing protein [Candidatus Neomarinimicrobiota bacterium]
MSAITDKKKYLRPETVALLNSMELRARLVVEGYIIGLHRSPYHGFSVEFAEHRSYESGDEIRHIDWKLFGKTDRLYVKRYEEETNLRSHIILDVSKSMLYASNGISKLTYANTLAASLSYLMINQQDAVGLVQFSEKIKTIIPPKAKPSHLNLILTQLDDQKVGEDTKVGKILQEMADRIRKRGLIILISDLFDDFKNIMKGLKHFRHLNQEVIVFHILDRKEFDFDFNTRTKFLDMETGEEIVTEPWHIRSNYNSLIQNLQEDYTKDCREYKIDYVPIFTNQNLDTSLTAYFNKRRKLF